MLMIPINDIFDVSIIAGVLVLAVLAASARKRILRPPYRLRSGHIERARKAFLWAHIKLLRARAKHAERKFARPVRLATNSDFSRGGVRITSNLTQAS